jgi:hypothetical protein
MPAPSIRRAQAEYLSQLLCGLGDGAEHGNHCSDTTSIQNEWGQAVRPIALGGLGRLPCHVPVIKNGSHTLPQTITLC